MFQGEELLNIYREQSPGTWVVREILLCLYGVHMDGGGERERERELAS